MEGSFLVGHRGDGAVGSGASPVVAEPLWKRRRNAFVERLLRWWGFLLVVVLPTLITAIYYFGFAANQYQAEAHFVVKTAAQSSSGYNGLLQMFSMAGGLNPSQTESLSVGDYLSSHDAVAALRKQMDLIGMFRRPEADLVSRLWYAEPLAEDLVKYYRNQVGLSFSAETGITTLTVRAFRPGDAQALAEALLEIGEQRVNMLNQRAAENTQRVAEEQLRQAEAAVTASQSGMTDFRQGEKDIDPQRSSSAQIALVSGLQRQLVMAQAQLATMQATLDANSPQLAAQRERIRALEAQYQAQSEQLAGATNSMAPGLSTYEGLKLRQDFAAKRYEAAASVLQTAREQALKQHLYVIRLVEPNLPEKSLYPKSWLMVFSVLFASLLVYGIGTLMLAGLREHIT